MDIEKISPDHIEYLRWSFISVNATLVYTWGVMALLCYVSWFVTRHLTSQPQISRWQNLLEILVSGMNDQIRAVSNQDPKPYLPFIGTLFLFILISNILSVIPGFIAPTGSLSTTTALALCVFFAVPIYGIRRQGLKNYLKNYIRPTPLMLPFNILGELSRTLALAVRLFGNIMSGAKIVAILLVVAPLFFPVLLNLLGLLTGVIQAYIFALLAMVYIASAVQSHEETASQSTTSEGVKQSSHG